MKLKKTFGKYLSKDFKSFQSHLIPAIPPRYLTNSAKQDDKAACYAQ